MNLKNLKWFGTALCLIGIGLTSFNLYPANILFGLVGSGLWTAAGYMQDDAPLMLVEAVSTALYAVGVASYIYLAAIKWIV